MLPKLSESRKLGTLALQKLDQLQSDGKTQSKQQLNDALRLLVGMRDRLIERGRAGEPAAEMLSETNGLLSSLFGTEFPKGGLQWQRVCEAREHLSALLQRPEKGK